MLPEQPWNIAVIGFPRRACVVVPAPGYQPAMDQQCEGSGRELPKGPPPDVATACPVCGREVKVEEVDEGQRFAVENHQKVVDVSS